MAPPVGFWHFMDEVHEMTFPMASIDWRNTPVVERVEPGPVRVLVANRHPASEHDESKDEVRQQKALVLGEEENLAKVNTHQLFEDLNNRNRELLREKKKAVKWQDASSMVIKEAKDEAETRRQEAKDAKKAGLRIAATVQRQLHDYKSEVGALKRDRALAAEEKTRVGAKYREEMSVAEGKIEELQTELNSAISNGRESIGLFDELSRNSKEMQNELVAKDKKLVAKDKENKVLQDRIDARDSTIQDVSAEAGKDREACNKYCSEKFESERAQRDAERKVCDLEREAITVKARTDKAMKALQTKLDESMGRETEANARATKAEGDGEQLKRELDNTESARQAFEKKEGEWATLFAENQANNGTLSQSTLTAANTSVSETEKQLPTNTTVNELDFSKLAEELPEKNGGLLEKPEQQAPAPDTESQGKIKELEGVVEDWKRAWKGVEDGAEEWKRGVRREVDENNQTVLATERENIRRELNVEKQKTLAAERKIIRGNAKRSSRARLTVKLKSQKNKELQRLRRRAATEEGKKLNGKKGQAEWEVVKAVSPPVDTDQSQLETKIRSQLQTEFQNDLSNHKKQWEAEHIAMERPQLETQIRNQIRNQLQNEFQSQLSNFKTQWEVEHSPSQAGLESQKNADSEDQIEVDEPGDARSAAARSAEDDMLLASLSRESDETHELFQEIGRIGLPHDSGACTILRELNRAKDALYEVKCELRKPDAVVDKNNLLYSVGRIHVNEHYIQQLNPDTREVLIRQANEANRRLEYVQNTLGTNNDVPKDAMLESLLAPIKTETPHKQVSAPPQTVNGSGNASPPGSSAITQKFKGLGNAAAPGTSAFPLTVGNGATPGTSETDYKPSSKPRKALNGFGDTAAPRTSRTSKKGVFNPLEDSHFATDPSLDSTPYQNSQDSGASDGMTEAEKQRKAKFKKTFGPLLPQGEGPKSPVNVNIASGPEPIFNFSSTAPADSSDKDHQMDTDGDKSPFPMPRDHSGAAGVGSVSSRPRQAKKSQGQQRGFAPKGRQLANQAFVRRHNVFASMPTQAQQANPQEQVPIIQQVGSVEFPRSTFTLEPNHAFDLTPSSSHIERGSHLRVQQDPAEYQKPLKIFQIPEEASSVSEQGEGIAMSRGDKNVDQSCPPGLMPPQAEDDIPETPPGCEGWTGEMEKHAKVFLKDVDVEIDQVKAKLCWLYPTNENMTGLARHLENLKREIEAEEPDQVQNERKPEQPAGWTNEMTAFVEGSLCGGNDVKTTVNLLKLENTEAFDIQGLEEQVERLKNQYVNKKKAQVQQDQVPREPLGWTDKMTATIQDYLRNGDRNVDLMVQSLEVVEDEALYVEGVHEHVARLKLDFEAQEQDQTDQD